MAPASRAQRPLSVRLPRVASNVLPDLPPISALFLIDFDVKAGYTIVWKQAEPGLELEGAVEYKSLPSGLHTVKDDLIYFVHDAGYAGLSAFVNMPCDEEEARHARMIAVGILVPLSFGRLGRAWRHAEGLKDMAWKLAVDRKQTSILEEYWEKCKAGTTRDQAPDEISLPLASPSAAPQSAHQRTGHTRNRSASDGTALVPPGHKLSSYHPARSLTSLLDTFGPLIFPIHRAALLRKRILISCHAPVHETCNFVYDLSVLSNIPQIVADILPAQALTHRLRPLFTIGVHDIPLLLQDVDSNKQQQAAGDSDSAVVDEAPAGWIACTTDSILAMKDTLWDMLITLPPPCSSDAAEKMWPTVECPHGKPIRATQRDLRRFRSLKAGLTRLIFETRPAPPPDTPRSESSTTLRPSTGTTVTGADSDETLDKVVEPTTWAALAYGGFMWWASAGEQRRSDEHDEAFHDASLLADMTAPAATPMWMPTPTLRGPRLSQEAMTDSIASLSGARRSGSVPDDEARVELAIIGYFHRLTVDILCVLGEAVDADLSDSEMDEESERDGSEDVLLRPRGGDGEARPIRIDSHAFELMGLDVWSTSDGEFLRELAAMYFNRRVHIEGKGVEICGIRVC